MNSKKKRQLIMGCFAVAGTPLFDIYGSAFAKSGIKDLVVALLDVRVVAENQKFQLELETEATLQFPSSLKLKIINIPFSVHKDLAALSDLVKKLNPDVCIAVTALAAARAVQVLPTTPILFSLTVDPVKLGFTPSSHKPSKNMTGLTSFSPTHLKRWELLFEAFPKISKIVVLADSAWPLLTQLKADAVLVRAKLGRIEIIEIDVKQNISEQITEALNEIGVGVDVPHTGVTSAKPFEIIDLISSTKLPCIYDGTHYVNWGGLMSYDADPLPEAKTLVAMLTMLGNGTAVSQIPVRFPSSYTLALNLETATNMGVKLDKTTLRRVTQVFKTATRTLSK